MKKFVSIFLVLVIVLAFVGSSYAAVVTVESRRIEWKDTNDGFNWTLVGLQCANAQINTLTGPSGSGYMSYPPDVTTTSKIYWWGTRERKSFIYNYYHPDYGMYQKTGETWYYNWGVSSF